MKKEKNRQGNQDWPLQRLRQQWSRDIEQRQQNTTQNQNNPHPTKTQNVNQAASDGLEIRENINKKSLKIPKG